MGKRSISSHQDAGNQNEVTDEVYCPKYGDIVFAKFQFQWWPAMVIQGKDIGLAPAAAGRSWVMWFGEKKISEVSHICKFDTDFFKKFKSNKSKKFQKAITDAIQEMCLRANITVGENHLISLAKNNFYYEKQNITLSCLGPIVSCEVKEKLESIKHGGTSDFDEPNLPVVEAVFKEMEKLSYGVKIETNSLCSPKKRKFRNGSVKHNCSPNDSERPIDVRKVIKIKNDLIEKHTTSLNVDSLSPHKKRGRKKKNELNVSNISHNKDSKNELLCNYGDIVFARYHRQWWPAMKIKGADCNKPPAKTGFIWVLWFGESNYSQVSKICPFTENFLVYYNSQNTKNYKKSIKEALLEICARANIELPEDQLLYLALNDFYHEESKTFLSALGPTISNVMKLKLQSLVAATDESESEDDDTGKERPLIRVRKRDVNIQDICVSCDMNNAKVSHQHPIIQGGLCNYCAKHLKLNLFSYSQEDKLYTHCFLCASGHEPVICDNIQCYRSFCVECIEMLVSEEALNIVKKENPWLCFLCKEYDKKTFGLIEIKPQWLKNMVNFTQPNQNYFFDDELFPSEKKPITILSFYDALEIGFKALNELGLELHNYYVSEIEKNSNSEFKVNTIFEDNVIHLGSSQQVTGLKLESIAPLDLIIFVSSENNISEGNLKDDHITKKFFEFYRLLENMQFINSKTKTPLFYLFAIFSAITDESKEVINCFLQAEPVLTVSLQISSQLHIWGNIPALHLAFKKSEYINQMNSQDLLPVMKHLLTPMKSFYKLRANHLDYRE